MPQQYRTRHLTAAETRLVDALEASGSLRDRKLAAKIRPPEALDPPPKPTRRSRKSRPDDDGADDIEHG